MNARTAERFVGVCSLICVRMCFFRCSDLHSLVCLGIAFNMSLYCAHKKQLFILLRAKWIVDDSSFEFILFFNFFIHSRHARDSFHVRVPQRFVAE